MFPRSTRRHEVGEAGEYAVCSAFFNLGWGAQPNDSHDMGTDIWAFPQVRHFEVGSPIGAQVKTTSQGAFKSPVREGDTVVGWWFDDPKGKHIPKWLSHNFPHIVVFHHLQSHTSYWAHVTGDAVERKGRRGGRLFVPKANTLDEAHVQDLLAVAVSVRPRIELQGTAWTGLASIQPHDLIRYALIVPRLVAPHPNAGTASAIEPEQAMALLVRGRHREIDRFAKAHEDVPTLANAEKSDEWSWRFVSALGRHILHGETQPLIELGPTAPDPAARVAADAVAAAALMESATPDEAMRLLKAALARDDAAPTDHAWLEVQYARACAETGRTSDSREAALRGQLARVLAPEDLTAHAIAGSAARLLFDVGLTPTNKPPKTEATVTSDADAATPDEPVTAAGVADAATRMAPARAEATRSPLEAVITDTDNAADWWQSQVIAGAVSPLVDRGFEWWTNPSGGSTGDDRGAYQLLVAAGTIASNSGDHAGWRAAATAIGKSTLTSLDRFAAPEEVASALERLRLGGDYNATRDAVRTVANNGPVGAVALAAADLDLDSLTRTTDSATLALIEHGGDLMSTEAANRAVIWLLKTLGDPSQFTARTRPQYFVPVRLLETLAGVLASSDAKHRQAVVEALSSLPAQGDDLTGTGWSWVAHALSPADVAPTIARQLAQNADTQPDELRFALLALAAPQHAESAQGLVEEAASGSLQAFRHLSDVRGLPPSGAKQLITSFAEATTSVITNAQNWSYTVSETRVEGLVLLNAWYPDLARWEPITALLSEKLVAPGDKTNALGALSRQADRLPQAVRPPWRRFSPT